MIKGLGKTWLIKLPLFLICFTFLVISGCEGTDSRGRLDDTVKELSGKKNIEHMDKMKKDIGDIQKKQADRLKEMNSNHDR
jgi:hypothetical protein